MKHLTFTPVPVPDKRKLKGVLTKPAQPAGLPENAQWLAGEGAGSWFAILPAGGEKFEITRFSPEGKVECSGRFAISGNQSFDIGKPYQFDYLSHCGKVSLIHGKQKIEFRRVKTENKLLQIKERMELLREPVAEVSF